MNEKENNIEKETPLRNPSYKKYKVSKPGHFNIFINYGEHAKQKQTNCNSEQSFRYGDKFKSIV